MTTKKKFAVILSDIHINKENKDLVFSILKDTYFYCKAEGIKYFIIAGDVFKERVGQDLISLVTFHKFIRLFSRGEVELLLIPGNHDKVDQDSPVSYLDIFKGKNVRLFREEDALVEGNIELCFLPYFKENGSYIQRLGNLSTGTIISGKNRQKRVLITHIGVNGVISIDDGKPMTYSVKRNMFSAFDEVFIGHFHNKSKLGKNINYIGSALPHTFGEDNDKGFCVLYEDATFEYVKTKFPHFIKKVFNLSTTNPELIQQAKQKYSNSKDHIRFVFIGKEDQLLGIREEEFESVGIEVKKESLRLIKNVEDAQLGEFIKFDEKIIKKGFLTYCSERKFSAKKIIEGVGMLNKI